MGCLYSLSFPSGKKYIGITAKSALARWGAHKARSRESLQYQAVQNAIRKYGHENVVVETLVVADDWDYLCSLEKSAIAAFCTMSPHGYNLTSGGEGVVGRKATNEQRARMSAAQKRRAAREPDLLKAKLKLAHDAKKVRDAARRVDGKAPWQVRKGQSSLKFTLGAEAAKIEHSRRTREAMAREDVSEKVKAAAAERARSPEWRRKIGESRIGMKLPPKTDAARSAISEARKREWKDPVIRLKRLEALKVARAAKRRPKQPGRAKHDNQAHGRRSQIG
jgi:hypothetical protein